LLYRDKNDLWNLIDWKTEWVNQQRMEELSREYNMQVDLYAQAVESFTGEHPRVYLCFLNPAVRVVELTRKKP
jgi:ATP-dependent exoDNAse (exonuclease V) beta subunit